MTFQSPGAILCQIGPLTVRWYGVMIALGFMLTVFSAARMTRARGLDADKIINLALICFISGVLGARLYYAALNPTYFFNHPAEILATWKGGLSIHGGLIGGALAGVLYLKKEKLPILTYCDIMCASLPLAQAVGRWGNFFNSEAFGHPVAPDFFLKLFIPVDARPQAYRSFEYFQPTFLYESLWNLGLFLVLYFVAEKKARGFPGMVSCLYLAGYSLGRLLIEPMRVDSIANYMNVPIPLLVSAGTMGVALLAMLRIYKKNAGATN
jgi:phosphatidylglycerol:prolipoprotein diacylglycerol transferase